MTDEIKVLKFYEGLPVTPPDPDDPLIAKLQVIKTFEQVDSTTTGSNATTETVTASIFKLTNSSLNSIDMIPGIAQGGWYIILNRTGGVVTFNNLTGATAGDQIDTGTGDNLDVEDGAGILVMKSPTVNKVQIVGGSGGGGGATSKKYALANNQTTTDITGLILDATKNKSYHLIVELERVGSSEYRQIIDIKAVYNGSSWALSFGLYFGDEIAQEGAPSGEQVQITVNSSTGQMQYASGNQSGHTSSSIKVIEMGLRI